jgi:hypothetical protein
MDDTLVSDIYYKLTEAWDFTTVPENNSILTRIKDNIKLYSNTPIEELDSKHSWIKVETPGIGNIKFINTKGFAEHLKICKEIDEYNKNIKYQGLTHSNQWKDHPIPWKNFLVLKAYRCVLTKALGFTYYVKNTYMIKPFHIIKHDWELKEITGRTTLYNCKSCGVDGSKKRGSPAAEIFPLQDFMLSCNEHMIKKLLE